MEENNFEKQVQQKMDELKIPPSESVWEKIEMRIEKRKPRRWIFFILPLFFILLLGGYWFYKPDNSRKENYAVSKNDFKKEIKKSSELKNENKSEKVNSADSVSITVKDEAREKPDKKKDFNPSYYKNGELKNTNSRIFRSKITSAETSAETLIADGNKKDNDAEDKNIIQFKKPEPPSQNENIIVQKNEPALDIDNNIFRKKWSENQIKEKDTSKGTITIAKKKELARDKWQVGFTVAAGVSGVGNKFLGLQNSVAADYLNSFPGSGQSSRSLPSKTKNSVAVIVGGFVEKNIFKKAKLSLGINFKSFNTTNGVGVKNDTTRGFAFGNQNIYHNHFSLIEFPVELKFQIFNSKKFPLFWNTGFTISQMLGSNALQFDGGAGFYFVDNSFFNKTKIGLNTGFAINILRSRNTSLLIGPYFFYELSKLSSQGLYDKKHFVFAGLRSEFLLKRK